MGEGGCKWGLDPSGRKRMEVSARSMSAVREAVTRCTTPTKTRLTRCPLDPQGSSVIRAIAAPYPGVWGSGMFDLNPVGLHGRGGQSRKAMVRRRRSPAGQAPSGTCISATLRPVIRFGKLSTPTGPGVHDLQDPQQGVVSRGEGGKM